MSRSFVHLHVHSEYSLANGIVRIPELVRSVAEAGMPAVAVTDLANLYAMVKFYRQAVGAGVKPLIGVDAWLENPAQRAAPFRCVLLVKDETGYRNLCRLITRAYREGQSNERPCIAADWLSRRAGGLIMLSGAQAGDVGAALASGDDERAERLADHYADLFGDRFYLEIQRVGRPHEEEFVDASLELAVNKSLPVVASNDVHFMAEQDFDAHEVRVCIHDGRVLNDTRRARHFTPRQYLRSPKEMLELFSDLPEAIDNTVQIAKRCNFELTTGDYYLPEFPVPEGETVESHLHKQTETGLTRILEQRDPAGGADAGEYRQRMDMELNVVNQMGFPGYFLIVADFIRWARENDIPVGPGRGSGAGSIVAYALGITELDPIEHKLLFERFLNPERVSMPDFDIDFCMEGRDQVIDYVTQRYGAGKVAQIITFGSMAARAVVRDVGRVLGMPYGQVDQLAKLIPFEIGMTLDKALQQEQLLAERYDSEEEVTALIDMARALEGLARNVGKHAGGVVIAPTDLVDFTPLYYEQGGDAAVTQFDKDDLEYLGLVKFDFLGLRTLTIIDWTMRAINAERQRQSDAPIDLASLPMDDPKAYKMLQDCRTTAMFQLESRGMKDLVKRLQPDCFEDMVALVALYRPGPLGSGMVDDFVDRKHGRKALAYPHPLLEDILKPTYGVILYQEQVMEIARVMGGYSLGGADLLRRAMGKKKADEMAKSRETFMDGARQRDIDERIAGQIFDLMEKFAGYGFNRSHSAAYALIAYHTAWLKSHYPAQFMAACMSADMEHTDKVVTLINESRDIDLTLLPPDVNRCFYMFRAVSETEILYGLGAIKGIGFAVIQNIVEAREAGGEFADLFDFCDRIDLKRINRRALESLVRAGALDGLGAHRASLWATLGVALDAAGQRSGDRDAGQSDMFGIAAPQETVNEYREVPEWDDRELLDGEKQTLGLYLSGHPIDGYNEELEQIVSCRLVDLNPVEAQTLCIAGLVVGIRTVNTRRGDKMSIVTLDDKTSRIDVTVFSELYNSHRDILRNDALLVVRGAVSTDSFTGGVKMVAEEVANIQQARESMARKLQITLRPQQLDNGLIEHLRELLPPSEEGNCRLGFEYIGPSGRCELSTPADWRIAPREGVLLQLRELVGNDAVKLYYQ